MVGRDDLSGDFRGAQVNINTAMPASSAAYPKPTSSSAGRTEQFAGCDARLYVWPVDRVITGTQRLCGTDRPDLPGSEFAVQPQ